MRERLVGGLVDPLDLIVANPPYIASGEVGELAPEIRDHEPRVALDGGSDGLATLRRVVTGARAHLAKAGVLAVEVGAGEAPLVADMFARAGFTDVAVRRDCGRIERVVSGVL